VNSGLIQSLLTPVVDLVRQAGSNALVRWGDVTAEIKPDQSLVTEVDRSTEDYLASRLTELLPGSGFAGEERGFRSQGTSYTWICDPIDGTTNFVAGLPHWCVSVGLVHEGNSVLGVIYAPALDRLYTGLIGDGAQCNHQPIIGQSATEMGHEDILCVSTSALKNLDFSRAPCRLRCLGSIALETCLVAEGRVLGAIGRGEGIVDLAGAICILNEAGCALTTLHGSAISTASLLDQWHTREPFITANFRTRETIVSLFAQATPRSGPAANGD